MNRNHVSAWHAGLGGLLSLAFIASSAAAGTAPPAARQELSGTARAYYYYSLAQRDRAQRDYREALSHLKNAVVFDPESVTLRLELARLYWLLRNKVNHFEQNAIEHGEEAVRLDPDSLTAHRFLAKVYGSQAVREGRVGDALERAILHYEKALSLAPPNDRKDERLELGRLFQQAARYDDAVKVLEDLVESDPSSVEGLYWLAMAYAGHGELSAAVRPLERAVGLSPQSIHLREALADLQERRGDLEGALETARSLVARAPEGLAHYIRLARLYRRDGEPLQALEVYDRADRVARANGEEGSSAALADLQLWRSTTLLDAGKPREALRVAARAAESYPDDLRFPLILGQLRYRTGDMDGGVETLEQVLASRLDDATLQRAVSDSFFALGAHEERAGNYVESEHLLQRSIDINPENDAALNYLGYMWADRGENLHQSVRYIERALRIAGENGAYLDSLGWAYFRQERYELAEVQLERAVKLSADEPEIHDHLGDLYHAMGRIRDAIRAWQQALETGAEDADGIRAKIERAQSDRGLPR